MQSPPPPPASEPGSRSLRRSREDRMFTGVAGGLGEYFAIDPVIFRVLFGVLSFFGGVGIVAYLVGWLLIPEPDVEASVLDRIVAQLRARRIPPWIVIAGGAMVLWLGWFSWWAPGPTFPALALIAVLLIVLISKSGKRFKAVPREAPSATAPNASEPPTQTEPLIRPMNDFRETMNVWVAEDRAARDQRRRRRRPILIGVGVTLMVGLTIIGIIDSVHRLAFGVYPWFLFGTFGAGLLTSLVTRRPTWRLLAPFIVSAAAVLALGSAKAGLGDGTGQQHASVSVEQGLADQRMFAGSTELDLSRLQPLTAPRTITITQAAGQVRLTVPRDLNITVVGQVHAGNIEVLNPDGNSENDGVNTKMTIPPADDSKKLGLPLTIRVNLTLGHVVIDRSS